MDIQLYNSELVAVVDDADYPLIKSYNWYVSRSATSPTVRYYARAKVGKKTILMHRIICNVHDSKIEIDYRSGDGLDNRRANLRTATRAQNAQNRCVKKTTKSGFRGVHWYARKQRWRAVVKMNGRSIFSRYFTNLSEAAIVVSNARKRLFPYTNETREVALN